MMEISLLFILLTILNGSPPPEVNEAHYLTKGKHFWNADYCPHDLFLLSSFSHWLFYTVFGWLTLFLSLETVAWMGRNMVHLLMAIGWYRLSRTIAPKRSLSVGSLALFFLLNHYFHLAGEWVIGGFEAKGIAYGLIFFAVSAAVTRSWGTVWLFLGGATAFHPIVGGWTWIALSIIRVGEGGFGPWQKNDPGISQATEWVSERLSWMLAIGVGLIGIIPPLVADLGIDQTTSFLAHQTHVMYRLPHHLYFGNFTTERVACFMTMTLGWAGVFYLVRRRWPENYFRQLSLLFYFGLFSLLISMAGLILSALAESEGPWSLAAISLLRFYWFRLSDFAIPISLSLAAVGGTNHLYQQSFHWQSGRSIRLSIGLSFAAILAATVAAIFERHQDHRPQSDRQSLPSYADSQRTIRSFQNWKNVCGWIAANTPTDSLFITPWQQQTFKWYAGRSEVVNWKDVPQDARSVAIWRERVYELVEPQRRYELGLMSYSDQQIRELAAKYAAQYLVVLQQDFRQSGSQLNIVYPENPTAKTGYVVIEL